MLFFGAVAATCWKINEDKEYWDQAPYPIHIFLITQLILKICLIRLPFLIRRQKHLDIIMALNVLLLIASTITGLIWLIKTKQEEPEFLTTSYYVSTIMLLSIPLLIASFLIVATIIGVVVFITTRRRQFARFRDFQDEEVDNGVIDQAQIDEIVETYMNMLIEQDFDKKTCKFNDCAICLKEFENGEKLTEIPNCEHVFHEACLRKWFRQLQICPMCRGNIIKMPGGGKKKILQRQSNNGNQSQNQGNQSNNDNSYIGDGYDIQRSQQNQVFQENNQNLQPPPANQNINQQPVIDLENSNNNNVNRGSQGSQQRNQHSQSIAAEGQLNSGRSGAPDVQIQIEEDMQQ
eukprot:403362142